jgi:hypothetical protein
MLINGLRTMSGAENVLIWMLRGSNEGKTERNSVQFISGCGC